MTKGSYTTKDLELFETKLTDEDIAQKLDRTVRGVRAMRQRIARSKEQSKHTKVMTKEEKLAYIKKIATEPTKRYIGSCSNLHTLNI